MPVMSAQKKSKEEHCQLLEQLIRLSLWLGAHWHNQHPEEPLASVLEKRTMLFAAMDANSSSLFDIATMHTTWNPLFQELLRLADDLSLSRQHAMPSATSQMLDPNTFEEQGWILLQPHTGKRVERDLEALHGGDAFANYTTSCLSYGTIEHGKPLEFHIANSLYPNSIFTPPGYIQDCLARLIKEAKAGGATGITTLTWLNELEPWLNCFPPTWRESLSAPFTDIEWHLGFWGQCLTARQTFSYKAGQYVREHGGFRYNMRRGTLLFDA